jgi:hypothetical protein
MKGSTGRNEAVQRLSNLIRYLKRKGQIRDWPVEQLGGRRIRVYRDRVLETTELKNVPQREPEQRRDTEGATVSN